MRCAKCRHSWFQHGPDLPERAAAPLETAAAAVAPAPAQGAFAAAGGVDTAPAPVAPPTAAPTPPPAPPPTPEPEPAPATWSSREPSAPVPTAVDDADDYSPFDHQPPFRPRRNPARLWTIAAVAFALTVGGLGAAAWHFGLPQWLPVAGQTFGADRPDLELSFPPERQDRRELPNGTEYFGASGTVTNVGKDVRALPEILIVLRDSSDKVVKTWEVPPPQDELAPGESVTINAAVTDVPKSAKFAEIGWKPD